MHVNALQSTVNSRVRILTLTFCFAVHPFCTQVCWTNQRDGLTGTSFTETSGSLQIPQERWTWSQQEMKTEGHTIDSPALACSQPVSSAFFFNCSNADIKIQRHLHFPERSIYVDDNAQASNLLSAAKSHIAVQNSERKKKSSIFLLSLPFYSQSSSPSLLYVKHSLLPSFCLSSESCGINLSGNLQMFWVKYKDGKGKKFSLYFIIHRAATASK